VKSSVAEGDSAASRWMNRRLSRRITGVFQKGSRRDADVESAPWGLRRGNMSRRLAWILLALTALSACRSPADTAASAQRSPAIDEREMRRIKSADLNLRPDTSTAVISSAQKFIIPVPAWGRNGEPLTYPKGHEREGQAILDFQGKAVGDRG